MSLTIGFVVFVLTVFTSSVSAVDLPFDPTDYNFLIYSPYPGNDYITDAMEHLGIHNYDVRNPTNPVTPTDIASHDILIVGWNANGNTNGLISKDLLAGITGRIILTGHDVDFHIVLDVEDAQTFLINAINYVLTGSGTGLITLGDYLNTFPYLPREWGVSAQISDGEDIDEITAEGLASGVYDGLDHNDMSDWSGTYHNKFTINSGSLFVPFELGGTNIANCHYL
jgi:hypothetical protein